MPEEYQDLPFVAKCCPLNEILVKGAGPTSLCVSSNDSSTMRFSPLFSTFNRTGMLVPGDEQERFVAVVGIPCQHRKYVLIGITRERFVTRPDPSNRVDTEENLPLDKPIQLWIRTIIDNRIHRSIGLSDGKFFSAHE